MTSTAAAVAAPGAVEAMEGINKEAGEGNRERIAFAQLSGMGDQVLTTKSQNLLCIQVLRYYVRADPATMIGSVHQFLSLSFTS